ncbi:DUF932 domain-containing protein [Methylovulum psychrotolerans]|uniref:DUF945 domain-containing protein n=1 Tax=Methylovulum psychrotolerans TaxID=1704499 RepID=A0A2S5CFT3_9GAMM|nr:DUF932 domain-containing protein [Methylovulum psychrotolerans]POZ49666.1 hypothetical protein AADEFJLK_04559 [Methylovulum psychrotolerans]
MATLAASFKNISGLVRSDRPLSNEQIFQAAPSVFADAPHGSRSARYAYIPTREVVDGLRSEGFMPFMACQARSRIEGKTEFTKHMLRFRYENSISGDTANEIILVNSHDGTSSYQMLAGCFRFVCHNGLICGETVEDLRVRHSGDVLTNVIEGAYRIVGEFEQVDSAKELMRGIALSQGQQNAFANAALQLRYDPEENVPILPHQLNQPRRTDDRGNDLWRTFNRIQENVIQGGLQGLNRNGGKVTTRKVTGLGETVRLNRALWTLAEEMAKLAA